MPLPNLTPQYVPAQPVVVGVKRDVRSWLNQGWIKAGFGQLPLGGFDECPVDGPQLTHAAALLAGKSLKTSPRILAQAWVDVLKANPHPFVEDISVVGPGHVNFKLSLEGQTHLLKDDGSFDPPDFQDPVLLEFVSANPTGPLHLGHARQAVLGDSLARLLRHFGARVGTEFYSNDDGAQIGHLVNSVSLRMRELLGEPLLFEKDQIEPEQNEQSVAPEPTHENFVSRALEFADVSIPLVFPKDGYHGKDIIVLAQEALACGLNPDDPGLKPFAIKHIATRQQFDLENMHVVFDGFASERSLHDEGLVDWVVEQLKPHAYQAQHALQEDPPAEPKPQAWFLRTTEHGDDKDRVMQKHDGSVPYFVPDVAYHWNKHKRGWTKALNIQGADHHGTLKRLQAGMNFLGVPNYPQVLFHTMVSVVKNGEVVQASKRAGTALAMSDLMEQIGVDALRMSLVSAHPNTPLVVDIDVWTQQGMSNPVYAVQYAHARLCSMIQKGQDTHEGVTNQPHWHPSEAKLVKQVLVFEDKLLKAAQHFDAVRVNTIVKELASCVHGAYQQAPKVIELDQPSKDMRLALYQSAQNALAVGHHILGVTLKNKMEPLAQQKPPRI